MQLQAFKQTRREMTHFFTYLMLHVNLSTLQPQPVFIYQFSLVSTHHTSYCWHFKSKRIDEKEKTTVWKREAGCEVGPHLCISSWHVDAAAGLKWWPQGGWLWWECGVHACMCTWQGAVEAQPHKDTKFQEWNSEDIYWSLALKVNAG